MKASINGPAFRNLPRSAQVRLVTEAMRKMEPAGMEGSHTVVTRRVAAVLKYDPRAFGLKGGAKGC